MNGHCRLTLISSPKVSSTVLQSGSSQTWLRTSSARVPLHSRFLPRSSFLEGETLARCTVVGSTCSEEVRELVRQPLISLLVASECFQCAFAQRSRGRCFGMGLVLAWTHSVCSWVQASRGTRALRESVIGCCIDRPRTLGHRFSVRWGPVVVKMGRAGPPTHGHWHQCEATSAFSTRDA